MMLRRTARRSAKPARQRALEFLANSSEGRTMLVMLARGFEPELLIDLVRDGLVTHTTESYIAAGRRDERVRLWITDAGRRALAEVKL